MPDALTTSALRIAAAFAACLLLAAAAQASPAAERAMDPAEAGRFFTQVEQRVRGIRTLDIHFVQQKHLELFADVVTAEGRLLFARPDRLRWEITKPFRSLLVVNGERLGKFDVRDGQPRKLRLAGAEAVGAMMQQLARWHQGRFRDQGDAYVAEVFEAPKSVRVSLKPRQAEMGRFIEAIDMVFHKEEQRIIRVTIREPGGDRTELSFDREVRNAELPDTVFDTDRPLLGPALLGNQ